ncbi:hypothetical protein EZV62_013800 [Acer yangbiense]|uniref:Uncharacterized protein n=1 Tax=Acer yangbiense TaxID=1000413 RepID=A0A5C7HQ92_9ROSI|nr:hypothetical protein EZV62_013800 [Acer yangbiense]
MKILDLFIASFIPVLKVLLLTALGLFLALDRVDVLGEEARKHLNNVAFYVFNPALVASSLAESITIKSFGILWFMPFNILFTFIIGSALGWILIKITRAPRDLWGLVIGCCAAGNLGNMLLIIIPAVCKERGSPFGNADVCYNQGIAYSSLSMAIGAIYLWSYVYNIVRIFSSKNSDEEAKVDDTDNIRPVGERDDGNLSPKEDHCIGPLLPVIGCSPKEDRLDQFERDCPISEGKTKLRFLIRIDLFFQKIASKVNLRKLLAPPTIAAIIGFMVGVIPQLRKVLIGDSAPLRVVEDCTSLLGKAAIPTVSLIVGANLLRGLKGGSRVQSSIIIGIIVIRYIALPIFGVGIVKASIHFGLVNSDPLYQFVLLLQFALPPAINIGTMTQLYGSGESECSLIMLWTYALASVSLTLWSTFFLCLVIEDRNNIWIDHELLEENSVERNPAKMKAMFNTTRETLAMKILDLFIASFIPVLKVLLLTALGLFLALDKVDILGEEARKHLNNIAFFVFTPALVGSSLAKYITIKSIGMLWFMPVNILITFIIGSALGWILIKITRAPRDLWGLVIGCCAAGNLGNMLFIIIPTVCKERGSPFGNANICYNQGMAYSSLSMAIGAIFLWSYVFNIVRLYSSKSFEATKLDNSTERQSINPVNERAENLSNSHTGPLLPLNESSVKAYHLDQFELDCPISEGRPKVPFLKKIKQCFQSFATKINLRKLFAPSTIGAIVGFMIGVNPRLQKMLVGDNAPLRVVEDFTALLGEAAIPTVTLIVGANLLGGLQGSRIHLSIIIGIIVIRYIALPILGVCIVKAAIHFGLVNSDPLYQFILLLQFALPPAIQIGTMTQLYGAGESECSVIMLWTYALASVSLTLWSTFFLWFVG